MDEVETMKIVHPNRDICQLWKSVGIPIHTDRNATAHKPDSIRFFVVPDKLADVTFIHPFRHQRNLGPLRVQRCAEQR